MYLYIYINVYTLNNTVLDPWRRPYDDVNTSISEEWCKNSPDEPTLWTSAVLPNAEDSDVSRPMEKRMDTLNSP
jgi:hypothetical protein